MAVPGQRIPDNAPTGLAETELFAVDAYLRDFESEVAEVDPEQRRVALRRTAFFPGGGGQPYDVGLVTWAHGASETTAPVTKVGRDRETGVIWHWLGGETVPQIGTELAGGARLGPPPPDHADAHRVAHPLRSHLDRVRARRHRRQHGSGQGQAGLPVRVDVGPSSVSGSSVGSTRRSTRRARSSSTSSVARSPTRTRP